MSIAEKQQSLFSEPGLHISLIFMASWHHCSNFSFNFIMSGVFFNSFQLFLSNNYLCCSTPVPCSNLFCILQLAVSHLKQISGLWETPFHFNKRWKLYFIRLKLNFWACFLFIYPMANQEFLVEALIALFFYFHITCPELKTSNFTTQKQCIETLPK